MKKVPNSDSRATTPLTEANSSNYEASGKLELDEHIIVPQQQPDAQNANADADVVGQVEQVAEVIKGEEGEGEVEGEVTSGEGEKGDCGEAFEGLDGLRGWVEEKVSG